MAHPPSDASLRSPSPPARRTEPPAVVAALVALRQHPCFPPEVRSAVPEVAARVLGLLFPHFAAHPDACDARAVERELLALEAQLDRLGAVLGAPAGAGARLVEALPALGQLLWQDADAFFGADPAARSVDEVIVAYPGFYAIALYRVAHVLHGLGFPLLPRLITELAHQRTGVDIHPGATIGPRFVIDHGTGVVIGETTVIGERVTLYQGVTLGAWMVSKDLRGQKRHPTLEDDVVVYANATVLGGSTVVGARSVIAGSAWVTQSVRPDSLVTRRNEVYPRGAGALSELEFHI